MSGGGGKRRVVSIKSAGSSNGRAAPPGARATAGWASSAGAPKPSQRNRGMPAWESRAGLPRKARLPAAGSARDRESRADHRWHRDSGAPIVLPRDYHRRSNSGTLPRPPPTSPRNSTAGWRPREPAGRRGWRRSGTPWLGALWTKCIPKMHPSRRGSSPRIPSSPLTRPPVVPTLPPDLWLKFTPPTSRRWIRTLSRAV